MFQQYFFRRLSNILPRVHLLIVTVGIVLSLSSVLWNWLIPRWQVYASEEIRLSQRLTKLSLQVMQYRQTTQAVNAIQRTIQRPSTPYQSLKDWLIASPQLKTWQLESAQISVELDGSWQELVNFQQQLTSRAPLESLKQLSLVNINDREQANTHRSLLLHLVFSHE